MIIKRKKLSNDVGKTLFLKKKEISTKNAYIRKMVSNAVGKTLF